MKKIIWIASYPKSGNTYVRLFLAHYLYSKKNKIEFNLIKKFPKFEKSSIFNEILKQDVLQNKFDYIKSSIQVQKKLIESRPQKELIFKTHHFFGEVNNHHFTNKQNTSSFIYIVRDPREVLVSYASHSGLTIDEQIKFFLSNNSAHIHDIEVIVNWGLHYKSWKSFRSVPSIFIKYEDLVSDPEKFFTKIINFLSNYIEIKFDVKLLKKTIDLINFNNLKEIEFNEGFYEAAPNATFFRSGKCDSWKKILNKEQASLIENYYCKEMEELSYLN